MGDRESYDVQMTGEFGRLDLNWLTLNEDPAKVKILRRYLTNKGIELNDLDTMIDSLLDWVSPNRGLHHLNAPEETDDYQPPHAPLTSVDELKRVFGWAEFTSRPGWDDDFTVLPSALLGQYRIDLAWASRDVLRALEISDDFVDRFLQLRRGPDGIDGTADDFQFGTTGGTSVPADVQAALGFNSPQFQQTQIANLLGFKLPVFRIVSLGRSGDVARSVQMIVGKGAGIGTPQVISWKEL
jgi:hypothetical protein